MADHPLKPATDHRLGRPLPHQLTNLIWANLKANYFFPPQGLCGIIFRFQKLSPSLRHVPIRSSPVRYCHIAITVQLACLRPAASVRSEPGSNSHIYSSHPVLCLTFLKSSNRNPTKQILTSITTLFPSYSSCTYNCPTTAIRASISSSLIHSI